MNIIYGVCSWGLGHATRSLPIIRKLIDENNKVTVISSGRSLELLKKELGENAEYADISDYPMLLSENARQFMAKSLIYWPIFIKKIESGLIQLNHLLKEKKYDLIVSDARYDMYNKKIPSYFISHQMRIMNPLRLQMFESGSERFNLFFFKRFAGIIVPDYREDNFSGDLSHNLKRIDEQKIHYVGILSDFQKKQVKKDIDYFLSISGPEPQRSYLEKILKSQVHGLDGKIVITLGISEKQSKMETKNIIIYSYLSKEKREDLLNRSKLIISRSGYSTLMDLGVIGAKAFLIPTPGQIEQEYLAQYHNEKGTFYSKSQDNVKLDTDIEIAKMKTGIEKTYDVSETVENVINVITDNN